MSTTFKDKVVVITGGGRGMGRAIAEAFAAEGAKLMITARTMKYGEQTVAEFRDRGVDVELCQVDVTQKADLVRLIDKTVQVFGTLDVLVHNAGECPSGPLLETSDEEIDAAFHGSCRALLWMLQNAHPHLMRARSGGRVIAISSIAGDGTTIPGLGIYGASKSALNAIVRSAALELAKDGITVNAIQPGMTATERFKDGITPEVAARAVMEIPIGRVARPEEIARAAIFLADPASAFITGATLTVDGGTTLCSFTAGQ